MAKNKIIYGGETLIDLTADTATADKVLDGFTFHGNDGEVKRGSCTYDANTQDATAQVAEVLNTKTFYAQGTKKTGSMPNIGKQTNVTISTKAGTVTIQQGYHDGSAKVGISTTEQAKLIAGNIKSGVTILGVQGDYTGESSENPEPNKDVTPSTSEQVITPDSGYTCLAQVTVKAIPYVETANSYGTTVMIG